MYKYDFLLLIPDIFVTAKTALYQVINAHFMYHCIVFYAVAVGQPTRWFCEVNKPIFVQEIQWILK